MTIRRAYVDGSWGQLHLRAAGSDRALPPLLMLHPTPKSGWIWEPLMPLLAAGRIVVAPDTPGYGASDPPPVPPTIEALADEMLALCDTLVAQAVLPPGPVDVMGYHTGSVIAAAMARRAPDRVRRLLLVSLPAYSPQERAAKLTRLDDWPGPKADGSHLGAMWRLVDGLTDPRAGTAWKHASVTENLRCGDRAPWGYRAVFGHDFQADLDALVQPTLIINPQDDLWQQTRDNVGRVRHARYLELPGVGHGLFDLDRDLIAGAALDFLDAPSPGTPDDS